MASNHPKQRKKHLSRQFRLCARRLDCFMSSKQLMAAARSGSHAFLEMEGRLLLCLYSMITQDISWEKTRHMLEISSVESSGLSEETRTFLTGFLKDQIKFEKAKAGKTLSKDDDEEV